MGTEQLLSPLFLCVHFSRINAISVRGFIVIFINIELIIYDISQNGRIKKYVQLCEDLLRSKGSRKIVFLHKKEIHNFKNYEIFLTFSLQILICRSHQTTKPQITYFYINNIGILSIGQKRVVLTTDEVLNLLIHFINFVVIARV